LIVAPQIATALRITPVLSPVQVAKPQSDLCPICVNFMDQALNALINIILNVGVIGSCGELCAYLPNKIEATVCDLLCDYVGIEEFIKIIDKEDPDSIAICEDMIPVCPIHDDGAANITSVVVSPPSGPQGTTFDISMEFTVTNETGTGEIVIDVFPPDAFPMGDGELNEGFKPGNYAVRFSLQANPSEQEPFTPGVYKVELAVCNGECGAEGIHPHSKLLSKYVSQFTITQ